MGSESGLLNTCQLTFSMAQLTCKSQKNDCEIEGSPLYGCSQMASISDACIWSCSQPSSTDFSEDAGYQQCTRCAHITLHFTTAALG